MKRGGVRKDGEELHLRLLWLVEHADQSRAEIAAALERQRGTLSPWFASTGWSLPDAAGLVGLAGVCTIGGERVSCRWLLNGEGPPTEGTSAEGALLYRGALMVVAELEITLLRLRDRLAFEARGVRAPGSKPPPADPADAAARLAETDRVLKKKRGRRQAG